jgi:hypothetical protein
MAVAFDSFFATSTNRKVVSVTPVGTPSGVIVFETANNANNTDNLATAITYGGVSMTKVTDTLPETTEWLASTFWFLGSDIPTGTQSVERTTVAADPLNSMTVVIVTADTDTEINDFKIIKSNSLASPSDTLPLSGVSSFVVEAAASGVATVGGMTPYSGWNSTWEADFGASCQLVYVYNTVAANNVTVGYTQSADDVALIAVAIKEAAGAAATSLFPKRAASPFIHMMVR